MYTHDNLNLINPTDPKEIVPADQAPVVLFRFSKDTQEADFLSVLAAIYDAEPGTFDHEVFADDKYFYVVQHARVAR